MCNLQDSIFTSEARARRHLERLLWPDGPVCPHCCATERLAKVKGKSGRPGLHYCNTCKRQFTVTVGTIFERSKVPLTKWLLAFHLMASSKKGISAHQLHRMLGVTYKTAWFMAHRIRESMRELSPTAMGGQNKVVEADESYVGGKARNAKRGAPPPKKEAVVALVERDGKVRSFHLPAVSRETLRPVLVTQIERKSYLMTDDAAVYKGIGREFSGHGSVNHSINEYVRGGFWHTNTVEGYFSIMKRGITGIYQHVSQQHLKRYLGEFDFRFNHRQIGDAARSAEAVRGAQGKRLTYRRIDQANYA